MDAALKFVTALSLRTPASQLQPCVGTGAGQLERGTSPEPLPMRIRAPCTIALGCMLRRQQADRYRKAGQADAPDVLHVYVHSARPEQDRKRGQAQAVCLERAAEHAPRS